MTDRELINLAFEGMVRAYSPYSGFTVGAALECEDGSVFLGCNVENSSFGCTVCAERVAVFKAISEGRRAFRRLAIAANSPEYCMPCGSCRQVLAEFSEDMEILSARQDGRYVSYRLNELLPKQYKGSGLKRETPAVPRMEEQAEE